MLTQEPEIRANYVATGQAKLVFWPVINHGNPSLYATLTMECVAQQSLPLAWEVHAYLFDHQADLWRADRDFFVTVANTVGVDQATFESCYDGQTALQTVLNLDFIRRERGITGQPFFDVNGTVLAGTFQLIDTIELALP
ncbi:MAG TPA: hypothetical protein ENJ56_04295 [Anaerolineae bacterium]|nr:hypothetical protein [Anaerolineae bacterium]